MARPCPIKPISKVEVPEHGLSLPAGNTVRGNCGVTAIAAAAGIPFSGALRALAVIRREPIYDGRRLRNRNQFSIGTFQSERKAALRHLKVDFKILFEADPLLKRRNPKSLELWVRYGRDKDPNKMYVVTTTGHVQVVRGLYVMDQRGPCHIKDYSLKGKRITSILEINK